MLTIKRIQYLLQVPEIMERFTLFLSLCLTSSMLMPSRSPPSGLSILCIERVEFCKNAVRMAIQVKKAQQDSFPREIVDKGNYRSVRNIRMMKVQGCLKKKLELPIFQITFVFQTPKISTPVENFGL